MFAGSIAFLVYSAGQLPTTLSAPLYFLALPYFYSWCVSASWRSLLKGIALTLAAASAHHVTLIFGSVLFARAGLVAGMVRRPRVDGHKMGAVPHYRARLGLRRDCRSRGWGRPVAILDRDHPPSHRADADSARQPFEFPDELALRNELLRRAVWRIDPGAAVHCDQGCVESSSASTAARVLGYVPDRVGRHHAGPSLDLRPGLRNSHLRALHAVGNGAGAADCRIAGRSKSSTVFRAGVRSASVQPLLPAWPSRWVG